MGAEHYTAERGDVPGIVRITPTRNSDERGYMGEIYNQNAFAELGVDTPFVQDNHSRTRQKHTLRGLHFQLPPLAQAKLLRCVRGAVLSASVDLRPGSPSYGGYDLTRLDEGEGRLVFVPAGFAQGFLTLEDECDVHWKVSAGFSPDGRAGLTWNDPRVGIPWPLKPGEAPILSPVDQSQPTLDELERAGVRAA